jgi:hypothetical protein
LLHAYARKDSNVEDTDYGATALLFNTLTYSVRTRCDCSIGLFPQPVLRVQDVEAKKQTHVTPDFAVIHVPDFCPPTRNQVMDSANSLKICYIVENKPKPKEENKTSLAFVKHLTQIARQMTHAFLFQDAPHVFVFMIMNDRFSLFSAEKPDNLQSILRLQRCMDKSSQSWDREIMDTIPDILGDCRNLSLSNPTADVQLVLRQVKEAFCSRYLIPNPIYCHHSIYNNQSNDFSRMFQRALVLISGFAQEHCDIDCNTSNIWPRFADDESPQERVMLENESVIMQPWDAKIHSV